MIFGLSLMLAGAARAGDELRAAECVRDGVAQIIVVSGAPEAHSREILTTLDGYRVPYALVSTRDYPKQNLSLVTVRIDAENIETAQGALDDLAKRSGVDWACDAVLMPSAR